MKWPLDIILRHLFVDFVLFIVLSWVQRKMVRHPVNCCIGMLFIFILYLRATKLCDSRLSWVVERIEYELNGTTSTVYLLSKCMSLCSFLNKHLLHGKSIDVFYKRWIMTVIDYRITWFQYFYRLMQMMQIHNYDYKAS